MQPRFSHDGTRIVHSTGSANIWVLDLSGKGHTRLRTEQSRDQQPSWSADDRWILWASDRAGGGLQIWRQAADGTGEPERPVDSGIYPIVAPGGTRLLFTVQDSPGNTDIMQMALDGSRRVSPLLKTPFDEGLGEVSPDGHWLAYRSNYSGSPQVFVRPYPDTESGRWQVSTAGDNFPRWRRDGRELFFIAPDGALMGVQVSSTRATWTATPPVKVLAPGYWSRVEIGPNYDVSPDGKRFLVVTPPRDVGDPPDLVVIQHWNEEVTARVPANASIF
jgi:eukaryotic-like serine/threonine-protein kinase